MTPNERAAAPSSRSHRGELVHWSYGTCCQAWEAPAGGDPQSPILTLKAASRSSPGVRCLREVSFGLSQAGRGMRAADQAEPFLLSRVRSRLGQAVAGRVLIATEPRLSLVCIAVRRGQGPDAALDVSSRPAPAGYPQFQ